MHSNALSEEKSPYLRQHAHNPVEWLPWGETAFQKARESNRPIFLSVGYSTCHWCHVMAHESFEDESVAEVLNREFVPVKVDREERPDVDRIYMLFVQATTGSGGWPMSVWLTPGLKPFFGGTYFPPDSRYGRPGFRSLLLQIAETWRNERQRIEQSGEQVVEQLKEIVASAKAALEPDKELFAAAYWQFRRIYDARWGGFGGAPKFPRPVVLNYLLRYGAAEKSEEAREMAAATLKAMADGGMHDQLGGGFHRYSVDERWFVPHFEKMLYDQAQLAVAYLEAYQVTHDERLAEVARDIFQYVQRDLTDQGGGLYSAEDADSADPENPAHSGEGAFYIWRQAEIERLLGAADARAFCAAYGVEPDGNVENDPQGEFTGRNILYRAAPGTETVQRGARILFEAREKRARPQLDNKILTAWNGLMISAFAKGYSVLGEEQYREAARRAATFLLGELYDPSTGGLLRRCCGGEAAIPGFLDDYAFLAQGLLDLYEATFETRYLEVAIDFCRRGLARFEDAEAGGFFSTEAGASDLLLRMKEDYDGAEPSGNSVAVDVLLRLAQLTGDEAFRRRAERSLRAMAAKMKAQPSMAPQMLAALGRWLTEPEHVVVRCRELDAQAVAVLKPRQSEFAPYRTLAIVTDEAARQLIEAAPFLASLERRGRMTLYECRNFVCELPTTIDTNEQQSAAFQAG